MDTAPMCSYLGAIPHLRISFHEKSSEDKVTNHKSGNSGLAIAGRIGFGGLALVAATTMFAVPTAQAGVLCDVTGGVVCGRVQNLPSSKASILVYDNWAGGNTPAGNPVSLAPGQKSGFKDTDGFCIPKGRSAAILTVGPDGYYMPDQYIAASSPNRCFKVLDGNTAQVEVK